MEMVRTHTTHMHAHAHAHHLHPHGIDLKTDDENFIIFQELPKVKMKLFEDVRTMHTFHRAIMSVD